MMSTDAMDLVAAIVQRNTDDAARISNDLIEHERGYAIQFAKALLVLVDAVEDARVVDRFLLDTLRALDTSVDRAEAYLERRRVYESGLARADREPRAPENHGGNDG
jgi:hypothetical protein